MITPENFKANVTGISTIDFEHWHLLKQLDRASQANTFEEAQIRVDEFIVAWMLHHEHEDQFMQDIKFPDAKSHIDGHLRLHEVYRRMRHDALNAGHNLKSAKAYIGMVAQLVRDHINQYDSQYAEWAKSHATTEQIERFGIGHPTIVGLTKLSERHGILPVQVSGAKQSYGFAQTFPSPLAGYSASSRPKPPESPT